jgi:uncharacterized ubiquitin-like protein YukD
VKKLANYLKHENQLIVWPVLKELTENDMLVGNLGLRARYDMSIRELLDACLEAWEVTENKNYRLVLIRADGEHEISSADQTVKEAGLRNGDHLEIVSA